RCVEHKSEPSLNVIKEFWSSGASFSNNTGCTLLSSFPDLSQEIISFMSELPEAKSIVFGCVYEDEVTLKNIRRMITNNPEIGTMGLLAASGMIDPELDSPFLIAFIEE